jgi:hypothetical protein
MKGDDIIHNTSIFPPFYVSFHIQVTIVIKSGCYVQQTVRGSKLVNFSVANDLLFYLLIVYLIMLSDVEGSDRGLVSEQSRHLSGGNEKNPQTPVMIDDLRVEI